MNFPQSTLYITTRHNYLSIWLHQNFWQKTSSKHPLVHVLIGHIHMLLGIFFQVICHNLSQFQNMEVSCQLVTGPVYLAGETITCQVSVVNNAATTQVSVLWGSALDCSSLGFLKSRFQVLAWASASLHCFCTVSDSKVGVVVLHSDGYVPYACIFLLTNLF